MNNQNESNPINPAHYFSENGKECISEMYEIFGRYEVMVFCKLNAFKYRFRKEKKGVAEQDEKKAVWYDTLYEYLKAGANFKDALNECKKLN